MGGEWIPIKGDASSWTPPHPKRQKGNGWLGRHHSEKTKKKMSENRKGKKKATRTYEHRLHLSLANKGQKAWSKGLSLGSTGKHHSPEWKRGMSEKMKGKKSHLYKDGLSLTRKKGRDLSMRNIEYKIWRSAVFQRDNYTCIWCGDNKGHNLEADHIQTYAKYPELRLSIDNGRTLCKKCHKLRHSSTEE
jgi:hypothetical protein